MKGNKAAEKEERKRRKRRNFVPRKQKKEEFCQTGGIEKVEKKKKMEKEENPAQHPLAHTHTQIRTHAQTYVHIRLIFAPFKHPPIKLKMRKNEERRQPERRKAKSEKSDAHKVGCSSKKNKSRHVCSLPGSKDRFHPSQRLLGLIKRLLFHFLACYPVVKICWSAGRLIAVVTGPVGRRWPGASGTPQSLFAHQGPYP